MPSNSPVDASRSPASAGAAALVVAAVVAVAAALLLLPVPALAQAAPAPVQIDGDRVVQQTLAPADQARADYEYHVLAGEIAIQRGMAAIAAREYVAALQYSSDAKLAERATRIALYADKPVLAYRAAVAWASQAPKSFDAQRAATRLAFVQGDAAMLAGYAQALVDAAPSPDAGYRVLADSVSGDATQAGLALATLQSLVERNPKSAPAEYALGVVALRYNRIDQADKAAASARKLDGQWSDAALLQAGIWIRQGKVDAAQKLVNSLSGSKTKRAQYHLALAQLLVQADATRAARDEFARAVAIDPSQNDARFGVAILSMGLGDNARARTQLERLYKHDARADDAAYYLGLIADQNKNYSQAQSWFQRVQNGPHEFESQLRAAQMIAEQGQLPAARKRLDQLREAYPDQLSQIAAAEGQLLIDAKKLDAAVDVFDTALKTDPKDGDLLYGRSLVYEQMGRIKAAEADLRTMLKLDDKDPRALNALGYMLTNHSTEYKEAAGYIRTALAAAPDNPAVLDSMGWVQYKLGEIEKARKNLEQAYKGSPDPEVAAHLGEVRWAQGDRAGARKVWNAALSKSPDNPVLKTTMKKFGA